MTDRISIEHLQLMADTARNLYHLGSRLIRPCKLHGFEGDELTEMADWLNERLEKLEKLEDDSRQPLLEQFVLDVQAELYKGEFWTALDDLPGMLEMVKQLVRRQEVIKDILRQTDYDKWERIKEIADK